MIVEVESAQQRSWEGGNSKQESLPWEYFAFQVVLLPTIRTRISVKYNMYPKQVNYVSFGLIGRLWCCALGLRIMPAECQPHCLLLCSPQTTQLSTQGLDFLFSRRILIISCIRAKLNGTGQPTGISCNCTPATASHH